MTPPSFGDPPVFDHCPDAAAHAQHLDAMRRLLCCYAPVFLAAILYQAIRGRRAAAESAAKQRFLSILVSAGILLAAAVIVGWFPALYTRT